MCVCVCVCVDVFSSFETQNSCCVLFLCYGYESNFENCYLVAYQATYFWRFANYQNNNWERVQRFVHDTRIQSKCLDHFRTVREISLPSMCACIYVFRTVHSRDYNFLEQQQSMITENKILGSLTIL